MLGAAGAALRLRFGDSAGFWASPDEGSLEVVGVEEMDAESRFLACSE
jgi:hypothetical protein